MPIAVNIIAYLALAGLIIWALLHFGKKNRELTDKMDDIYETALRNPKKK